MKLRTRLSRAALLCGIVLLFHASTSAQEPRTPGIEGTYVLDDPAAVETVKKAIKAGVEGMGWPAGGMAVGRLEKINLPPYRRITIRVGVRDSDVSIATDARAPIVTPPDGKPFVWTREDKEKLKVSTVLPAGGGPLKQTFSSPDGERVNTYVLSADGKTMTMQVVVSSKRLPRPVEYALKYKRCPLEARRGAEAEPRLTKKARRRRPAAKASRAAAGNADCPPLPLSSPHNSEAIAPRRGSTAALASRRLSSRRP